MRTRIAVWSAMLGLAIGCAVQASYAQDADSSPKPTAEQRAATAYRLDFAVNEMEDGKNINTRQYSMNLNSGDANSVKIGTRVPVEAKQGEFQYIDVGTNIWCRLEERSKGLLLSIRSEISNFAVPDQQSRGAMPLLRQLQINASTVAVIGKPLVVGSVDDPNSKRQFQLEVTTTKLR